MSTTSLYFLTMLDGIKDLFQGLIIVCILFTITLLIILACTWEDIKIKTKLLFRKYIIISTITCLIVSTIYILIPTTKQAAFIYMAEKISNNEDAKQIPQNTIKFLNLKLQEYIKDQEIKINKKGE